MSQALYRKWRPQRWEQVIGQEHIVQTLRNAVAAERVAHAYLFAGPRGTGKTTTARLLAKAVNCLDLDLKSVPCDRCEHCKAVNQGRFLDLIEIDAASNTSVDDVRDLREKINFLPNQGRYKVYIVDEVHMLSTAAFNALLKTLEEPPPHAIFVLATTEIHKIPATVLSRCQRHEFRRIPVKDIVACLKEIAAAENVQVEEDALALIARQSTGALRDAISLLDQLASTGQLITLAVAQTVLGTAASQSILDLIDAMHANDPASGLDHLHTALDSGSDPRQFARQVVDYLRSLLLVRMGSADQVDATAELRAQMAQHAQQFETSDLLNLVRVFNQAATDARAAWQPSLPLELAFIEGLGLGKEGSPAGGSGDKDGRTKAGVDQRDAAPLAPIPNQTPEEVEAETTPAEMDGEGQLTLKMVNENWKQVLSLVRRQSSQVEALLRSGRLLGVKDGVLYFGISSEVLKSKIEKSESLELIEGVLRQVLQRNVPVRCLVASGKTNTLPPDIDSDGMVASALRDLGGEIVDVQ